MNIRFYNAGHKIDELISFTLPEGGDIHFIGHWPLLAPKESWFDVPTEIEVRGIGIAVSFAKDIQQRFGKRGVVRLDPNFDVQKEIGEEPEKFPIATTEELCIAKGEVLWKRWLRGIVEGHLQDCQNAMAAGGAPRAASGFTKHALELLGIGDPGEQYFLNLKNGNGNGASNDVKQILAAQGQMLQTFMTLLLAQASGQKLDPEAIKAAMEPVKTPDTLTTGIMTGKTAKPVDMRGAGPDADIFDRKVKQKAERTKEAAAAL